VSRRKIDPKEAAHLVKALGHPLRIRVLIALDAAEGPQSPSQLAEELEEKLPNLSYHVRMLVQEGAMKLKRTKPRRGAIEHFYEATPLARKALDLFEAIS
jgi:DNA-binding transcriptional ArsR family regulator